MRPVQEQAVWPGVLEKESMWAFADQGSYKMTLRSTMKNIKKAQKKAKELQKIINENFSDEKLYKIFVDSVLGFDSSLIEPVEDVVLEFE